jgi:predicted ABC-type ATPase
VPDRVDLPCIYVLAGVNGAGKSSLAGAMFMEQHVDCFDPDVAARRILEANPGIKQREANSVAWFEGKRLLKRAIAERLNFAFETTLGGRTIASLLEAAAVAGTTVRVWYVGLKTPELHIARVRSRVARGGHDIPEDQIRARYVASRLNLIRILPHLAELRMFDNTEEADPAAGATPNPRLILHMTRGKVVKSCKLPETPDWAKPILATALM